MKILLLCEPRSGSTNLGNWFLQNKDFDVRYETTAYGSGWWAGPDPTANKLRPGYKHLVLKEIFYGRNSEIKVDWLKFMEYCDKTIFLFREDSDDQVISWNHAKVTGNFCGQYPADSVRLVGDNVNYFNKIKTHFKKFREEHKDKALTISYEDLYYRGKIHILKEYLGIADELDYKFPFGQRYRYEKQKQDPNKLI